MKDGLYVFQNCLKTVSLYERNGHKSDFARTAAVSGSPEKKPRHSRRDLSGTRSLNLHFSPESERIDDHSFDLSPGYFFKRGAVVGQL